MDKKLSNLIQLKLKNTSFINIKALFSKTIQILMISNKFPFGKQDFKYSVGYKDNKEINLYANSMHIPLSIMLIPSCIFMLILCIL